ncbi:lysophospholipid acyltransferase family protein [Rhizohabitans arisaemae]|uniref:lysophospholipid acyltransferase family protein n=1 Tax=Rhizohabitans arisaemae TaxID=2720610 RepID=UPI0031FE89A5
MKPLLLALVKRDWRGRGNLPREEGVILAVNHISTIDPLLLAHFVYKSGRWPVYLAKDGVFKVKGLGYALRRLRQIPVYRGSGDAALSLREAEQGLKNGACVIVYPEGTCTRDPDLWPMTGKTGVARLALKTGAKVIPIAQWGAQDLLPYRKKKLSLFPRKTFRVLAGPPVDLSAYQDKPLRGSTLRDATADIMGAVTEQLAELRREKAPELPYDARPAVDS